MRKTLFWTLGLLLAGVAWIGLMRTSPEMAEQLYARTWFPSFSQPASHWSGFFAAPVGELLLVLAVVAGLIHLAGALARSLVRRTPAPLGRYAVRALLALSAIFLWFSLGWAPLYSRKTLGDNLFLNMRPRQAQELTALAQELMSLTAQKREALPESGYGTIELPYSLHQLLAEVPPLMRGLEEISPLLGGDYAAPKAARYPELWDALGISGIYLPFTFEAVINPDDLDSVLPFTATHEAAHQRGWAREDEASFVGLLACLRGDAYFQYSGALAGLKYALEALKPVDGDAYLALLEQLPDGVIRDLNDAGALCEIELSPLRQLQNSATHVFLRLNGQRDGLHSYGRVVDLMLAWREFNGGQLT